MTSAAVEFEVEVQAQICFQPMTTRRSQTKEWLPWFHFPSKERVECVFRKKPMSYRRDRYLEHYGYQTNPEKLLKAICAKMPMVVRDWFKHCDNVVPGGMSHLEMYGTLAASSGATQPVQVPPSTHSRDMNGSGVLRMAKVVQCKSNCSHAKNVVAVIHITRGHYASNNFLRLTTSQSAKSWMKNELRSSMS